MSPAPTKMNPFPGLRPFTQEEDYLFFGREEQTLELLQRLGSNRFVAVVGTSGSGKSSLVRCGLLSELLGGRMLEAGAAWEIAVTHPGGNPLALLTDALLEADRKSTRLNSSHQIISYAVFCLKKKKKLKQRQHGKHTSVTTGSPA